MKGMKFIVIITIKELYNRSYIMWEVIEFQQNLGNDMKEGEINK